jgi:DNA repair protein RadC
MYSLPVVRLSVVRESTVKAESKKIKSSEDVFTLLKDYMATLDREEFWVVMLDAKHTVTGLHKVSVGALTGTIVHPREVFKAAVLSNAAAIIAVHNHPSGDPEPSAEDRSLTVKLKNAGGIIGISLLDHVVIGHGSYVSFADRGW